jgi:hypothetical protein
MSDVNLVWAIVVVALFAAGFAFALGLGLRGAWREWHHRASR